ncbi:MAG: LysM peptidoglycan-binding domain-containing protein [Phototrophicaceae bacterium]
MTKHFIHITLLMLAVVFITPLNMGYAQDTNLLSNPGFEGAFTNQGGTPPRQVASSWIAWHEPTAEGAPNYQNAQPEYEEGGANANRVRSGSNSQHYFSFFATHTGGIYQTVSGLNSGSEYMFNIYVYVWSSTFDDLNLSQDDGDVLTQIGIDPTGGTNPFSDDILWSIAKEEYDTFGLHSINAVAESSSITVFVQSRVSFPVKNSSVYIDDASLTLVSGEAGEGVGVTATTVVPTGTSTATAVPTQTSEPTQQVVATSVSTVESTPSNATDFASPTPEDEVVATSTPSSTSLPTATAVATTTAGTPTGGTPVAETPITETFPGTIVHTVRRGDTLSRIAALYGSTIAAIQQANQLPDANSIIYIGDALIVPVRLDVLTSTPNPTSVVVATATPSNNTSGEIIRYTVQPGDTLSGIARRFTTSVAAIAQLNGIVNPDRVLFGQTLQIPSGQQGSVATPQPQSGGTTPQATPTTQSYVVLPGDNLYRLSLRFNVTMSALMAENNITDPNRILVGQTLRIPQSN